MVRLRTTLTELIDCQAAHGTDATGSCVLPPSVVVENRQQAPSFWLHNQRLWPHSLPPLWVTDRICVSHSPLWERCSNQSTPLLGAFIPRSNGVTSDGVCNFPVCRHLHLRQFLLQ